MEALTPLSRPVLTFRIARVVVRGPVQGVTVSAKTIRATVNLKFHGERVTPEGKKSKGDVKSVYRVPIMEPEDTGVPSPVFFSGRFPLNPCYSVGYPSLHLLRTHENHNSGMNYRQHPMTDIVVDIMDIIGRCIC